MSKYILTVTLNPAIDKTFNPVRSASVATAGGKGINVSRTLKDLGINVLATGLVGRDSMKFFKQQLDKEKIPHNFVPTKNPTRTNETILDLKKEEIPRRLGKGFTVDQKEIKQFKIKFRKLLKSATLAVLSGSKPQGVSDNIYLELIEIARDAGVECILDSHGPAFKHALKAKPLAIKPNREEAQEALGRPLRSQADLIEAVQYFLKRDVQNVFISLAQDGAIASNGKQIFSARPPDVKMINSVGCGDAFVAGFIFALQNNFTFEKALAWAIATGSANGLTVIPGQVYKKDVKRLNAQVIVKKLKFC